MRFRLLVLLLLGAGLAGCADDPQLGQGCVMETVAELPVLNDRGSPVVEVAINGAKSAFVVDTGARVSLIYEDAAERLGLPSDPEHFHLLNGIGGSVFSHLVTVDKLSLGTAAARHVELDSVPGGRPRSVGGLPVIGLFGGDFLANYDVEFDLPGHLVTLFKEVHCSNNLRPWQTGDYYRLPFTLENETAIRFDIAINGHNESVVLDSGAFRTIIDNDAANDGGANRQTMAQDRTNIARGIDGNGLIAHRHRFDSLDIGPEHFAPAYLDVADLDTPGLVGADFFRARKVWISYPHQVFYVQRVLFPHRAAPKQPDATSPNAPKH
ncbi:pepsin/retropepsin-like aspartic protease family protein [Acetobacteraceae bacterium KSS8]|uniref:Pepsin/retropepsin-like aspartic protease family protein n=1 Tax=Endosaccharibacter trunci TaxID=2812733 RepID=A0ABT1W9V9_9PROT|nr:pepsin/retropepsin-like aspartic protease family protein [Acetobacteraceae bacterium KSS8]